MPTSLAEQSKLFPGIVHPLPPPDIKPGWETAAPDFVGVGTMRSGTTWWWTLMAEHPRFADLHIRHKEVHFFDHYLGVEEVDPTSYHRYFPRPEGMVCGEWTPRYMYDFWTPPMLRRAAPEAKLLVLLRDPVERYLSGLSLNKGRGFPLSQGVLHQQFERSLYGQQLRMLFQHFPMRQVLVLQYEQCAAAPVTHIRRTLEFIGLDPGEWRSEAAIPRRVSVSSAAKPELDPGTRAALAAGLRADLPGLFELVPSLDPALWPTAAGL